MPGSGDSTGSFPADALGRSWPCPDCVVPVAVETERTEAELGHLLVRDLTALGMRPLSISTRTRSPVSARVAAMRSRMAIRGLRGEGDRIGLGSVLLLERPPRRYLPGSAKTEHRKCQNGSDEEE